MCEGYRNHPKRKKTNLIHFTNQSLRQRLKNKNENKYGFANQEENK
jgi:hypothetical protein